MKNRTVGFSAPLVILLALAATAQTPSTPSATGHGQISDKSGTQTFSFNAQVQQDGLETGQAEYTNRDTGLKLHVNVDCVTVTGNQAILSGVITQSTDPKVINDQFVISVTDNGEGVNDKPDTMSFTQITDPAKCLTCKSKFRLSEFPITRGNIQVRGGASCPAGLEFCPSLGKCIDRAIEKCPL